MCARRLFTQQCRDFLLLHALTVVCGLLAVLCGLAPVPATSIVLVPYSGFLGFLGFTYPKVVPKTTRVAHVGGLYGVWGERRYHVATETRAVLRNRSPWAGSARPLCDVPHRGLGGSRRFPYLGPQARRDVRCLLRGAVPLGRLHALLGVYVP